MEDLSMDFEVNDSLHINELPDVCLRHIFSFLPILQRLEIEKVCKRWRMIGEKGWPDMKKLVTVVYYSDNILHLIFKRCGRFLRKLKILELAGQSNIFSMILQFCKLDQLTSIFIYISRASGVWDIDRKIGQLREIFEKTTKLVELEYCGNLGLGTDWLNSANLQDLQLLCVMDSRKELLSINPDQFPNLKKLTLKNIVMVGGEIQRKEQSLEGLRIMDLRKSYIQDFLRRIETFENLQKLHLKDNICDMKNKHIRNIARNCCKLREIYLTCSPRMTSQFFKYLGMMPSLEVFDLKNLRKVHSRDISYLKNVNHLSFEACSGDLTGDGTIELIAKSTNLEYLRFSSIHALNMTFLNNVRRIFHRNLRKKPLNLDVCAMIMNSEDTEVINHPLLELNVYPNELQRELNEDA